MTAGLTADPQQVVTDSTVIAGVVTDAVVPVATDATPIAKVLADGAAVVVDPQQLGSDA